MPEILNYLTIEPDPVHRPSCPRCWRCWRCCQSPCWTMWVWVGVSARLGFPRQDNGKTAKMGAVEAYTSGRTRVGKLCNACPSCSSTSMQTDRTGQDRCLSRLGVPSSLLKCWKSTCLAGSEIESTYPSHPAGCGGGLDTQHCRRLQCKRALAKHMERRHSLDPRRDQASQSQ
jgi:hypothetical protein